MILINKVTPFANETYQKDLMECLLKNADVSFITNIVVFYNNTNIVLPKSNKVKLVVKNGYSDYDIIDYCKRIYKEDIFIFANPFTIFNNTLIHLEKPLNNVIKLNDAYIFSRNTNIKHDELIDNLFIETISNSKIITQTKQIWSKEFKLVVNSDISFKPRISKENQKRINNFLSENKKEYKVPKIDIIIVSVNYNDFLPITLKSIPNEITVTVVTSKEDKECQLICETIGVNCIISDRLYENGAVFNKGKAINDGIKSIQNPEWILLLDADIYLKDDFINVISSTNLPSQDLIICKRLIIDDYDTFLKWKNGENVGTMERAKGYGFFHLFNIKSVKKKPIFPENYNDASFSDLEFRDMFNSKKELDTYVVHLGPTHQNWTGRKTRSFVENDKEEFDINEYFDKIYCLNLERRTDRWEKVKKQFDENKINVEKWTAVNGENIPNAFFNELIPKNKSEKELSNLGIYENKNALACLLSHLSIIKNAKYKKYKRILIFEDDVKIEDDFRLRIKDCKTIDWKLLYLGSSQFNWNNIEYTEDNRFYLANQSLGTFAYAIDHRLYDEIISVLEKNNNIKSVDNLLADIQYSEKGNCFVYNKNIVTSNMIESDIRGVKINNEFFNFDVETKLHNKSLKFNKLSAILNLVDIRDVLEDFNIDYWLTDGTLLGLYRQGDFISHDMDTDIGVLYDTFNPIVIQKIIERGFSIHKTYGVLDNGFEIAFIRNNVKTDLFFFYKNDKILWHSAWYSEDDINFKMIKYEYMNFEISKNYFYGYQFNTPIKIEEYIVRKYGNDWNIPNSNWDWKFSPKNHIKTNISYNINEFNESKYSIINKSNLINKVTLIVKSFKREDCLINLISSIRRFYKFIKIIIVDDSDVDININTDDNLEFYKIPFDSGLSKGRNYAVSKVKTDYFVLLDDDFEFTNETNLEKWLSIIENSELDILGGDVIMNGSKMEYNGLYHFDNAESKLVYKYGFYEDKIYYKTYDFILNFFIARTSSILVNKWDDDLKLAEHTAFFFDNKGKIKVGHTDMISINHQKVLDGDYIEYRKRGTMFFNS